MPCCTGTAAMDLAATPKIAEGWTAELYAMSPTVVLKLYRPGFEGVGHAEFGKTRHLRTQTPLVPEVFEETLVRGRAGYLMERIDAPALGRLPERSDAAIAQTLFETQQRFRGLRGNELFAPVSERIAQRLGAARSSLGSAAERALAVLAMAGGSAPTLCHGDYHPGNLLLGAGGARVIDWNGAVIGPLEADVAKSLLLMLYAPPTLAWDGALHGRRREISRFYLELLRAERRFDEAALGRWLFVRLVEFFTLPVPALHAPLRPLAERWATTATFAAEEMWR